MTCRNLGGVVVCGEELQTVKDEADGSARWCFRCRAVREFRFIVKAPVGYSYYGPNPSIRCATCDLSDGDLFPGRFREWDES